jgi:hypothetical protein
MLGLRMSEKFLQQTISWKMGSEKKATLQNGFGNRFTTFGLHGFRC